MFLVNCMVWQYNTANGCRYQLYVRAIDPAGNRDATYLMNYNVYNWYYLSPTPWDIILGKYVLYLMCTLCITCINPCVVCPRFVCFENVTHRRDIYGLHYSYASIVCNAYR